MRIFEKTATVTTAVAVPTVTYSFRIVDDAAYVILSHPGQPSVERPVADLVGEVAALVLRDQLVALAEAWVGGQGMTLSVKVALDPVEDVQ